MLTISEYLRSNDSQNGGLEDFYGIFNSLVPPFIKIDLKSTDMYLQKKAVWHLKEQTILIFQINQSFSNIVIALIVSMVVFHIQ